MILMNTCFTVAWWWLIVALTNPDRQTDRKRLLKAYRALAQVGLNKSLCQNVGSNPSGFSLIAFPEKMFIFYIQTIYQKWILFYKIWLINFTQFLGTPCRYKDYVYMSQNGWTWCKIWPFGKVYTKQGFWQFYKSRHRFKSGLDQLYKSITTWLNH